MALQTGFKTQASIGVESTPGTPVSSTVGLRVSDVGLVPSLKSEAIKTLNGDGVAPIAAGTPLQVAIEVQGSVKLPACYKGGALGTLLEMVMGAVTTTGTGPYAHEFTLAASQGAMTVYIERGSTGADDKFSGVKIGKFDLSLDVGKVGEVSVDLLGMSAVSRTGQSVTAVTTPYYIKHNHCGTLAFNSNTYTLSKLSLVIDRKLARVDELGTLYSGEPTATDLMEVMLETELNTRDNTLQVASTAQTQSDAVITLTDGTNSMEITLQNAVVVSYQDPINSVGLIKQVVKFQGFGDGTKHGLKVILTNGDSNNRSS